MKKILALLFIAFAFTACSKSGDSNATDTSATTTDSTAAETADTNTTDSNDAADAGANADAADAATNTSDADSIFDFSSPEAFATSLAKVQQSLSTADQIKFGEGLAVIGMEMTIKGLTNPEKYANIEGNMDLTKEIYGGKSVADIIARAADKEKVSAELQKVMMEKQK